MADATVSYIEVSDPADAPPRNYFSQISFSVGVLIAEEMIFASIHRTHMRVARVDSMHLVDER